MSASIAALRCNRRSESRPGVESGTPFYLSAVAGQGYHSRGTDRGVQHERRRFQHERSESIPLAYLRERHSALARHELRSRVFRSEHDQLPRGGYRRGARAQRRAIGMAQLGLVVGLGALGLLRRCVVGSRRRAQALRAGIDHPFLTVLGALGCRDVLCVLCSLLESSWASPKGRSCRFASPS